MKPTSSAEQRGRHILIYEPQPRQQFFNGASTTQYLEERNSREFTAISVRSVIWLSDILHKAWSSLLISPFNKPPIIPCVPYRGHRSLSQTIADDHLPYLFAQSDFAMRTLPSIPFRGFISSSVTIVDETHFLGRAAWTSHIDIRTTAKAKFHFADSSPVP